jgi:uncharacterized phage protein (TIGR02218 family)
MRILPAGLQSHLDSGATTLCWCWRVTRNDGARLGFTDHDRDLIFDGTTYEASSGFTATEIAGSVGLTVDNLDVESAITSDRLSEADLAAGLYDNATIEIFRVNWQEVSQRVLMRYGSIGEVSRGTTHFKAEVRGLAHELAQPKGRIIQSACDADLGDNRCTVDLNDPAFKGIGAVSAAFDPRTVTATGLDAFAEDWFTRGLLTWTSGANAGRSAEVKLHSKRDGAVTLELWQAPAEPMVVTDAFTITAGCDKTFATCKAKFANGVNFRGFPHVPGVDFALAVPDRGGKNDGGSMNRG